MENPVLPSSCVTPAGTSIEVQNEWEENTNTLKSIKPRLLVKKLTKAGFFHTFPLRSNTTSAPRNEHAHARTRKHTDNIIYIYIWEPGTVITAPIRFLPIQRVITGIVPRTFRRYQVPRFSKLSIHRLSSSRLLARRAKVGHQPSSATVSSLPLALSQSLISSIIRTSRSTLPRLSVGGGRTVPVTVDPRGSPLAGPPSIHSRVVVRLPPGHR